MASAIFRLSIPSAVHPHTRGDDVSSSRVPIFLLGSPPHAWGRRRASSGASRAHRFTPTRVGTTATERTNTLARIGSPPHAWGRLPYHPDHSKSRRSTPHAWGRLPYHPDHSKSRRFTPTRVGTTSGKGLSDSWYAVHPHTRGDDCRSAAFNPGRVGSPPHAWGRRRREGRWKRGRRFTPTRVGTTV